MTTTMVPSGKGGVGKSLKTELTAYGYVLITREEMAEQNLREPHRKILVMDLDSQAASTRRLGVQAKPGKSMAEVLDPDDPISIKDVIQPCGWDEPLCEGILYVAPASQLLERRERENSQPGANRRLVKPVLDIMDEYDILIDLPSSITHIMEIAAVVSDQWMGVTQPEIDPINELARVHNRLTVTWKEKAICEQLEFIGCTVNMIDPNERVEVHQNGLALLKAKYGDKLWSETNTKRMTRLSEVANYAMPPDKLPKSTAKEMDYIVNNSMALARRVMSGGLNQV